MKPRVSRTKQLICSDYWPALWTVFTNDAFNGERGRGGEIYMEFNVWIRCYILWGDRPRFCSNQTLQKSRDCHPSTFRISIHYSEVFSEVSRDVSQCSFQHPVFLQKPFSVDFYVVYLLMCTFEKMENGGIWHGAQRFESHVIFIWERPSSILFHSNPPEIYGWASVHIFRSQALFEKL